MKTQIETYWAVRSECREGCYVETRMCGTLKQALREAVQLPQPWKPESLVVVKTTHITDYLTYEEWSSMQVEEDPE